MMDLHFGICEWSLPVSGPLAIAIAKEAGYEGMQIGEAGGRKMGYPLNNPRVQSAYLEAASQQQIELHSLNLGALLAEGTLNYSKATKEGEWARESLRRGFDVCRDMNIGTVVITVDPKTEETTNNVVENLAYAEELAAACGVEIAVESANPLDEILAILDKVSDKTKICMDLLNPLRFGTGNPQEQTRVFGKDRISHFHMKDSTKDLFVLGQRGCTLLGQGDAGIGESVEIIKEMNYSGWLITENYYYLPPMNDGTADFIALAATDMSAMKKMFGI